MPFETYLNLSYVERFIINDELNELIDKANENGEIRNKDLRR